MVRTVLEIVESTDERSEERPAAPDSVLGKTNRLLGAFTQGHATLGLTELSRRSGVSKGSAHRLAKELVELGYLSRTPDGYQLGWRIFEFGKLVPGPAALREVARPIMQDLRSATRAIVHLSVRHGAECLYLERVAGRGDLATVEHLAERVPQHATASGRIFLAYAEEGTGLPALPAGTERADIEERLETIRLRRYAVEASTLVRGVKGIAVPVVYPRTQHVIAALSLSLPVTRKDDAQVIGALWAASADITRGLDKQSSPRRNGDAAPSQGAWGWAL